MPFKDREKKRVYQRAWAAAKRVKNPEPSRISARKYRAANLEIVRKKDRERKRRLKAEEFFDSWWRTLWTDDHPRWRGCLPSAPR
jgi:hypothetical protein